MEFIDKDLDRYVVEHTQDEASVLKKLNRDTNANVLMPRMLSGHLQGRVLAMLSKMISPKNILEIGTYTGYSAICLSEGLAEDGSLHTVDIKEEYEDMVRAYFEESGNSDKIHFHIGDAIELVPKLDLKWDLVFIDADKENYSNYFDLVIDNVQSGGYIIADNVLWSGKVIPKFREKLDPDTKAIIEFNQKVHEDDRVENVLFPIRDGLMVLRKR